MQTDITYETPSQPRQLRLDTVTHCNAFCLSCHRFQTKRNGVMPLELLTKLLEDVRKWQKPLAEIVPVNYGEFLLYPDWGKVLSLITQLLPHTRLVLPTNGKLLTDEAVKTLAACPNLELINFSVNAFFEDTYKQFMGLPATTIKQIERLIPLVKAWRKDITIILPTQIILLVLD